MTLRQNRKKQDEDVPEQMQRPEDYDCLCV